MKTEAVKKRTTGLIWSGKVLLNSHMWDLVVGLMQSVCVIVQLCISMRACSSITATPPPKKKSTCSKISRIPSSHLKVYTCSCFSLLRGGLWLLSFLPVTGGFFFLGVSRTLYANALCCVWNSLQGWHRTFRQEHQLLSLWRNVFYISYALWCLCSNLKVARGFLCPPPPLCDFSPPCHHDPKWLHTCNEAPKYV